MVKKKAKAPDVSVLFSQLRQLAVEDGPRDKRMLWVARRFARSLVGMGLTDFTTADGDQYEATRSGFMHDGPRFTRKAQSCDLVDIVVEFPAILQRHVKERLFRAKDAEEVTQGLDALMAVIEGEK